MSFYANVAIVFVLQTFFSPLDYVYFESVNKQNEIWKMEAKKKHYRQKIALKSETHIFLICIRTQCCSALNCYFQHALICTIKQHVWVLTAGGTAVTAARLRKNSVENAWQQSSLSNAFKYLHVLELCKRVFYAVINHSFFFSFIWTDCFCCRILMSK